MFYEVVANEISFRLHIEYFNTYNTYFNATSLDNDFEQKYNYQKQLLHNCIPMYSTNLQLTANTNKKS